MLSDGDSSRLPILSHAGSSHSEVSLEDIDLPVEPLPLRPPSTAFHKQHEVSGDMPPPLQVANGEPEGLDPLSGEDMEPGCFDLVMPDTHEQTEVAPKAKGKHKLEVRSELLFSKRHLQAIFADPLHLHRFSNYLYRHRPGSVPLLTYYLDALKALRAIDYGNSVLQTLNQLTDFDFTHESIQAPPVENNALREKAETAFDIMVQEDLPMYITHNWIQTVSMSIRQRIMGNPHHESEGLAEVFCITDPSRPDNPIVFMSEQFNRTTQYGVDYVIGRNCRFLQGPCTNPFSVKRIREKLEAGVEHYETFLNYRRDGSPFMNLVMLAPLYDNRGDIRYFIGAQVDVSGLAMSCYDLDSLKTLAEDKDAQLANKDEFTHLAEILGPDELEVVRSRGGVMHRQPLQADAGFRRYEKIALKRQNATKEPAAATNPDPPTNTRVVLGTGSKTHHHTKQESVTAANLNINHNGRLTGIYENYLLVRPYPSLRILFTSPSMRVPGILQSRLLDRIGGSSGMRTQLVRALADGQSVTAKIKWLNVTNKPATYENRPHIKKMHYGHPLEAHLDNIDDSDSSADSDDSTGRSRWLHCTPLIGSYGRVGVWMIVIVDDDSEAKGLTAKPSKAVMTEHPRSDTAMSARATPFEENLGRADYEMGPPRPPLRLRRSSETLGSVATTAPYNGNSNDNSSVAKARRQDHRSILSSISGSELSPKSHGAASRFFSLAALSRASLNNNGQNSHGKQAKYPPSRV